MITKIELREANLAYVRAIQILWIPGACIFVTNIALIVLSMLSIRLGNQYSEVLQDAIVLSVLVFLSFRYFFKNTKSEFVAFHLLESRKLAYLNLALLVIYMIFGRYFFSHHKSSDAIQAFFRGACGGSYGFLIMNSLLFQPKLITLRHKNTFETSKGYKYFIALLFISMIVALIVQAIADKYSSV